MVQSPSGLHVSTSCPRKSHELNFNNTETKKYGIEVYKDEENGNLSYICETGSIAVVPAK